MIEWSKYSFSIEQILVKYYKFQLDRRKLTAKIYLTRIYYYVLV